ncbi:sugar ABC transporter substrate-binding protein [Mycobacterium sp. AT1]|uniref:sugar ABC transporter substrate-binding protein n=1 Tax=Mycobacterium sp. AT1 TaxID=1961706 RepID=UPI0009AEF4EE|nr:sugar ABC transporter substrate-binding protein [Mycobacterium sp. AT1]
MNQLRRGLTAGAVALALVAAGTACNRESTSGTMVGYSTYTVANPFFAGMQKGLDAGSSEHGYSLVTTNANGEPNQQVSDIQNLLNRGAKYLLLSPSDGKALAPALEAAKAKNVPVIAIADSVDVDITSTVNLDNVAAGRLAADQIVQHLTKVNGSPRGNIVNLTGLTGTPSARDRDAGFTSEIGKYPDIKIVATQDGGYDTEKSNTAMNDILQANPKIDAVFGGNDAEAVGASAAIAAAGRFVPVGAPGHIFVVGIDGSKPGIENVRNGVQDASISQNPIKMAQKAIDLVAELEAGKQVPKNVVWPAQLITRDNIDSPEVEQYGIWSNDV